MTAHPQPGQSGPEKTAAQIAAEARRIVDTVLRGKQDAGQGRGGGHLPDCLDRKFDHHAATGGDLDCSCGAEPAPCCDGCGDADPPHWRDGWYCDSCAACDFCGSPTCEDPSHAY